MVVNDQIKVKDSINVKLKSFDILQKYIEKRKEEREKNPIGVYTPDVNDSNFIAMNDNRTICALDDIIEKAKCVYGPYGGIFGEVAMDAQVSDMADDHMFSKSKDGHNYFMNISYDNTIDDVLLIMIKQYTKYIAGYRNRSTSKDGTTSLALLAAQLGKNALMARIVDPIGMRIPTTVENWMFDTIHNVTAEVVENNRIETYDVDTRTYKENGFNRCMDAIKTTVDNNAIMTRAFKELMTKCEKEKIDIPSANIGATIYKAGNPNLEFDVEVGINMRAFPLDKGNLTAFTENTSMTFILEGGISPEHKHLFKELFSKWIVNLVNVRDETNEAIFGMYHPNRYHAPVFLCTTPNDTLKEILLDIRAAGVPIQHGNGRDIERIKPIFMQLYSSDEFEDRYDDIRAVLKDNIISLSNLDKYYTTKIKEAGLSYFNPDGTPLRPFVAKDLSVLNDPYALEGILFPTIVPDKHQVVFLRDLEMVGGAWDAYHREENFHKGVKVQVVENPHIKSLDNFITTTNFNGVTFTCTLTSEDQLNAFKERRDLLVNLDESTSKVLGNDLHLKRRLEAFSGATITPMIYHRTGDEATLLQTLYEDAIGVFASVHIYGVMPGGNIAIIKLFNTIRANCMVKLNEFAETLGLDTDHRYCKYFNTILECILQAYIELFTMLFESRERGREVLANLVHINNIMHPELSKEGFEYAYDVVREDYRIGVFEAAQTTIDNFFGALSFTKDLLQLKTIKLKRGHYINQPQYRIVDGGPFHVRNKELESNEEVK